MKSLSPRWMVVLGMSLLLSSCIDQRPGIFGRLPQLYEQTAARQRDLEEMLSEADGSDANAQSRMAQFMQSVRNMERDVKAEARLLVGQSVVVDATPASRLKPEGGVIAAVNPGIVTTVEIRIPLATPMPATEPGYLYFIDEDGDPAGKAEAWYDPSLRALRIEVPFAVNPDGKTVPEGTFDHYDRAIQLRLVSAREYQADAFEGDPNGTLLTLEAPAETADTVAVADTSAEALTDSLVVDEIIDEPAWTGAVVTSKGVGPVVLGASLKGLPERVAGIYDSRRLETQLDEMEEEPMLTAVFFREGKQVMTALGDEQGNLVFLTVESPDIKMEIDGRYFGVGDPLQPLYSLKGVQRDETGAFAATYHGISIAPTPGGAIHAISVGAVW